MQQLSLLLTARWYGIWFRGGGEIIFGEPDWHDFGSSI